jgi:hypothetical protein
LLDVQLRIGQDLLGPPRRAYCGSSQQSRTRIVVPARRSWRAGSAFRDRDCGSRSEAHALLVAEADDLDGEGKRVPVRQVPRRIRCAEHAEHAVGRPASRRCRAASAGRRSARPRSGDQLPIASTFAVIRLLHPREHAGLALLRRAQGARQSTFELGWSAKRPSDP